MQTMPHLREIQVQTVATSPDPYPTYAGWRREAPLFACGERQLAVTRHADVSRLLRDRRVGHHVPRAYLESYFGPGPTADFQFNIILNRDAPEHTRLRRLMSQAFSRSLVLQLREWVTGMVDDLLVPLRDGAPFDVVEDLAFPLPTQVICELLGIPVADRDEVRAQTVGLSSTDRAESDAAVTWLRGYIGSVLADRRADREGDLLQRMLAAEDGDDALRHEEIVDNAALLFLAGFETTKHLISAGCSALLDFPDQQRRLWAEPAMAATAVEELLRFDGAVPFVVVFVHEPLTVGDFVVPRGSVLYLLLSCANRDEDVFDRPDELDIGRDPNPHVAFGGGLHLCLGAMLARLEGEVVFRRLAERTGGLEAAGPMVRPRSGLGAIESLPVQVVQPTSNAAITLASADCAVADR